MFTLVKFKYEGYVIKDKLKLSLLLGNNFLHPYNANILYVINTITFKVILEFDVPFKV
jgi:hypothetical protein